MSPALRPEQIRAYLDRLGYAGSLEPVPETLSALHLANRRMIPYENLDLWLGRPIAHDADSLVEKVVHQRRGGWCHEVNRLFAYLLQPLGFQVTYLSAAVHMISGDVSPDFSHLVLLVELPSGERWLADVGFGARGPLTPLRMDDFSPQESAGDLYRIGETENQRRFVYGRYQDAWAPLYSLCMTPRALSEFDPRCNAQQGEPGWTERRMATIATETGRVSLDGLKVTVTTGAGLSAVREERVLEDGAEWRAAVREHFGIDLPESARSDRM